jgi:hypothetical protein
MSDFRSYSELYHYGILGMKWGVRRYQNKDGSLTPEGKRRKNLSDSEAYKEYLKDKKDIDDKYGGAGALSFIGANAAGMMGGLAAGLAAGGGPVGVGVYLAVRVGAMIAAMPALAMIQRSNDKTMDEVKKSYGKKRINDMEKLCNEKVKNMSRYDIINVHNMLERNPTDEEKKRINSFNLEQLENDIINGKVSIDDLKKQQKKILEENESFYKKGGKKK